jgi:hypothetical protein
MSHASKVIIDLDRIDGANINLMGAQAILKIIECHLCEDGPIVELSNTVIAEALHGAGLLLDASRESLNGGDDE